MNLEKALSVGVVDLLFHILDPISNYTIEERRVFFQVAFVTEFGRKFWIYVSISDYLTFSYSLFFFYSLPLLSYTNLIIHKQVKSQSFTERALLYPISFFLSLFLASWPHTSQIPSSCLGTQGPTKYIAHCYVNPEPRPLFPCIASNDTRLVKLSKSWIDSPISTSWCYGWATVLRDPRGAISSPSNRSHVYNWTFVNFLNPVTSSWNLDIGAVPRSTFQTRSSARFCRVVHLTFDDSICPFRKDQIGVPR